MGGPIAAEASVGCNFPLRGGKATLFEGGMRGVSFVTGGALPSQAKGSTRHGLMQHVDVAVTLATLGGASLEGGYKVDGFNVWDAIVHGNESPRTEVPLNIDFSGAGPFGIGNFSAFIQGKWKLINTLSTITDGWWSTEPYTRTKPAKGQTQVHIDGWAVMLFNLDSDPQERKNVATENPEIARKMIHRIRQLAEPTNGYRDPQ